jgi:hypothetical protein
MTPSRSSEYMPRSRSTVRIARTPSPENCAGWLTAEHGVRLRVNVRPLSRLLSTVCPRNEPSRACSTASSTGSPGGGTIGCCWASMTSRAVPPFWRASTNVPSTSMVRSTFGAPETSISVTIVVSATATGAIAGAGRPGSGTKVGDTPFAEMASSRSPRNSSLCPSPSSGSVPVTVPLATSITRSVRSVTVKTRLPSVLRMSGSSTPISCVFVPENSGTDPPTPPAAGAGAAAAVSSRVAGGGSMGGVITASTGISPARGATPAPPFVRRAPARA